MVIMSISTVSACSTAELEPASEELSLLPQDLSRLQQKHELQHQRSVEDQNKGRRARK